MSDFPHQILDEVGHRPWPLPHGPWVMTQSWHDLLFAHWPVDAGALQDRLPAGLPLDTWLRLIIWMVLGVVVYFLYGYNHSKLRAKGR